MAPRKQLELMWDGCPKYKHDEALGASPSPDCGYCTHCIPWREELTPTLNKQRVPGTKPLEFCCEVDEYHLPQWSSNAENLRRKFNGGGKAEQDQPRKQRGKTKRAASST